MDKESSNKIVLCIPVYDDWDSVSKLLVDVDHSLASLNDCNHVDVLLLDDGSPTMSQPNIDASLKHIQNVEILRLSRNLGHQRAIAIGLSFLNEKRRFKAVVVMDADGQDTAEGSIKLIQEFNREGEQYVVFAKRQKRMDTFLFKCGYLAYRVLHRLLTGRSIAVGNFSILSAVHLKSLMSVPDLWNHYAASIFKVRLPRILIPIDRGPRIVGQSKMKLVGLIVHGLSAIAVYADEIGVRFMIFSFILLGMFILSLVSVVSIRLFTDLAIPGWATSTTGLLSILLSQVLLFALIFALMMLKGRSSSGFLPARDYHYFIDRIEKWEANG